MNGERVLYSVCVDDVKEVLQIELDLNFDELSSEAQEKVIYHALSVLSNLDWYQALDYGLQGVVQDFKQGYTQFEVVVFVDGKPEMYNTLRNARDAVKAIAQLKKDGVEARIVKKVFPPIQEKR